jgi:hypothetical protein
MHCQNYIAKCIDKTMYLKTSKYLIVENVKFSYNLNGASSYI